jgi:hypothetical protein
METLSGALGPTLSTWLVVSGSDGDSRSSDA